MREIKIYKYSELSEAAKKNAVAAYKEEMEENEQHEAQRWAIDDCALFEPKHHELVEILGANYYHDNGQSFIMKNDREGIEWDEYSLDIAEALEITNSSMFKKWLGIPEIFLDKVDYVIISATNTEIEFDHNELLGDPRTDALVSILENAEKKFSDLIEEIKVRIDKGIEEYFSDDNVIERIEGDGNVEFLENGKIWNS
jgi:hypothetical protein